MSVFMLCVILATLGEALVEYGKMLFIDRKFNWTLAFSLVLCVGGAFLLNVNFFQLLQIELTIPWIGIVLTGIVCSRGSNYVHDIVAKLRAILTTTEEV